MRGIAVTIIPAGDPLPEMAEAQLLFLRWYLCEVLRASRGNRCEAAMRAGVHRNTIGRLCDEAGIDKRFMKPGGPR